MIPVGVTHVTTKKGLTALVRELRALRPRWTYKRIGERYGINQGIVWKLLNVPGYKPARNTLHALGVRKDPRTRYRVSVDADTHALIKAEAARRGVPMAAVVREALHSVHR